MISFWETQQFPLTLESSHRHMLSPTLDRDFQAKGSWSVLGDPWQVEADFLFFFLRKLFSLKKNNVFIYDCTGSSLLCGLFSSCREWGLLSSCSVRAAHIELVSLVEPQGVWASVVAAPGLVPWPGIECEAPSLGARKVSLWTNREVLAPAFPYLHDSQGYLFVAYSLV